MINKTTTKAATKSGIRIKSRVKAGFVMRHNAASPTLMNHNQTVKGLRVKSRIRAGAGKVAQHDISFTDANHNHAVRGLRVKSSVKAGAKPSPTPVPS